MKKTRILFIILSILFILIFQTTVSAVDFNIIKPNDSQAIEKSNITNIIRLIIQIILLVVIPVCFILGIIMCVKFRNKDEIKFKTGRRIISITVIILIILILLNDILQPKYDL